MSYPSGSTRTGFLSVAAGDAVSDTNTDTLASGIVGYAQITADTSYFAQGAATLVTGLAVTITAAANRMYSVTVQVAALSLGPVGGANIGTWEIIAWDGTSLVGLASQIVIPQAMSYVILDTATTGANPAAVTFPGTQITGYSQPSAGTQTYSMRIQGSGPGSSTCAVMATASGSSKRTSSIIVRDEGPAF